MTLTQSSRSVRSLGVENNRVADWIKWDAGAEGKGKGCRLPPPVAVAIALSSNSPLPLLAEPGLQHPHPSSSFAYEANLQSRPRTTPSLLPLPPDAAGPANAARQGSPPPENEESCHNRLQTPGEGSSVCLIPRREFITEEIPWVYAEALLPMQAGRQGELLLNAFAEIIAAFHQY